MAKPRANSLQLHDTDRRAVALLSSINWSFDTPFYSRQRNEFLFDCRKHHWYPATFIPEIPFTLIEVLSKPGQVVSDPFAGIGTTVLQSLVLGRIPYGIERCRVAVEFVRSIWGLLDPSADLDRVQATLKIALDEYDARRRYEHDLPEVDREYVDSLRPWFNETTFNEISFLILQDRLHSRPAVRAALRVALSATLKAACAQDKGWGCIADNVHPKPQQVARYKPALERFSRNYLVLLRSIEMTRSRMAPSTLNFLRKADVSEHVVHGDARVDMVTGSSSSDLVITSPPYPSMTDYATSQRLSYYFLRSAPEEDFRTEIGARRRRTRPDALLAYRDDMSSALALVSKQMRMGAYACFVMPTFDVDRVNNLQRRRVVQECMSTLLKNGLEVVQQLDRVLPTRRRHHNQSWTSLERESIYVYRRVQT